MTQENSPFSFDDSQRPVDRFATADFFAGDGPNLSPLGSGIQQGLILRGTLRDEASLPRDDPTRMTDTKKAEFSQLVRENAEKLELPHSDEYWFGVINPYFQSAVDQRTAALRAHYPLTAPSHMYENPIVARNGVRERVGNIVRSTKERVASILPQRGIIFPRQALDTQPEVVRIKAE
ncbi:MAG TPA: hypothetical protein VG935_00320 [Patescibacteria group bacterium]|nr:hypothetical protein [Patescibacteria group bacterium]